MLACFDAHEARLAVVAFRVFERQTLAGTSVRARLVIIVHAADRLVAGDAVPTWRAGALSRLLVASTSARAIFLDTWAPLFRTEVAPVSFRSFWANALPVGALADVAAFHRAIVAVVTSLAVALIRLWVEDALILDAIALAVLDTHLVRRTFDAANSVGAWNKTASAAVAFARTAVWSFAANALPSWDAGALQGAFIAFAVREHNLAILVGRARVRLANLGDGRVSVNIENGRSGTRAAWVFASVSLKALVKVAQARAVGNAVSF